VPTAEGSNPDGDITSVTIQPASLAPETRVDTFKYTVSDGKGGFTEATVSVVITGVNEKPIGVADSAVAQERGSAAGTNPPLVISVLANDSDPDRDDSSATLHVQLPSATSTRGVPVTVVGGKTLSYDVGSVSTFDSLGVGQSATDTITYTVVDRHGATAQATVTVTIIGTNDAPIANADAFSAVAP
jgi:large repetitive protein